MSIQQKPIRVLATRWCGDCRSARQVLDQNDVAYEWIDIDDDEAAQAEVLRLNRGMRSVPTIIFGDGSVMVEPSRRELTAKLAELASSGVEPAPQVRMENRGGRSVDEIPTCRTPFLRRVRFGIRGIADIVRGQS